VSPARDGKENGGAIELLAPTTEETTNAPHNPATRIHLPSDMSYDSLQTMKPSMNRRSEENRQTEMRF
jgi:hypothetical protein